MNIAAKKISGVLLMAVLGLLVVLAVAPGAAFADASISKAKESLCVGDTLQLSVSGTDQAVTWKSGNASVATVSSKGKVKAKKTGTAVVTATAGEETLTCKVTVKTIAKSSKSKTYVLKGSKVTFANSTGASKVTYKSSNKKVFKIVSSSKKKVKIKALKNGKAYLLTKANGKTYVQTIEVATGKTYENKWIAQQAKQIKKAYKSAKDRIFYASAWVVDTFQYGDVSVKKDLSKVISKRKGNCYTAGLVLAKIYKKMGYKATVRSAIHDNMSRYPGGVFFGSDHYNIKVKAGDKTYYTDSTPGSGMTYLSTSKKPLLYYSWGMVFKYK